MLYKAFLIRNGDLLNEEAERGKVERRKERKKVKNVEEDVSESEDEEDDPILIRWEQEWWRKEGATIIT